MVQRYQTGSSAFIGKPGSALFTQGRGRMWEACRALPLDVVRIESNPELAQIAGQLVVAELKPKA